MLIYVHECYDYMCLFMCTSVVTVCLLMCMNVVTVCLFMCTRVVTVSVHHMYSVPTEARRGYQTTCDWLTGCYELPCRCLELYLGPLEEQPIFSASPAPLIIKTVTINEFMPNLTHCSTNKLDFTSLSFYLSKEIFFLIRLI